jgi:hypothetical protein
MRNSARDAVGVVYDHNVDREPELDLDLLADKFPLQLTTFPFEAHAEDRTIIRNSGRRQRWHEPLLVDQLRDSLRETLAHRLYRHAPSRL